LKLNFAVLLILLVACSSGSKLKKENITNTQLIAFVKDKNAVYLTNARGEFERKIHDAETSVTSLNWSPDDSLLVFLEKDETGEAHLITLTIDEPNTAKTIVTDIKSKLDKVRFTRSGDVLYCDEDGLVSSSIKSEKTRLIEDPEIKDFEYLADNHSIFFSNDTAFMKLDLETSKVMNLSAHRDQTAWNITFNADKSRLSYSAGDMIYIYETTSPHRFISSYKMEMPVFWSSWLRSGELVAQTGFISKDLRMEGDDPYFIISVTPDGTSFRAGGGESIKKRSQGKMAFYRMGMNGGGPVRIYSKIESAAMADPSLSGDTEYITYISNSLRSSRKVYVLSITSGEIAQLSKKGFAYSPVWQNTNRTFSAANEQR